MSKMRIALLGKGYWGTNLARCCTARGIDLSIVDPNRADCLAGIDDVYGNVDGVIVATPPATHCTAVLAAAERFPGAKILVEKPMVLTDGAVATLEPLKERIMVDHTFLFVPEFRFIKEHLQEWGEILYMSTERLNLGKFQDCGVVWDLAPHDVAVFTWLAGSAPSKAEVTASSCVYSKEDIADMTLHFPNRPTTAHIRMSWIHPTKVRRTTLVCSNATVVYDMLGIEKVKIYETSEIQQEPSNYAEYLMAHRKGPVMSPHVPQYEPLQQVVDEFCAWIRGGPKPVSDFDLGATVVATIAKAHPYFKAE